MLLLAGHVLRASRLIALYPAAARVRRFDLLLALGMGYVVNTVIPWRAGEVVRTLYVGKRCNIRYAFVAATVLAERLSDAAFIGLFAAILFAVHRLPHDLIYVAVTVFAFSAVGILVAFLTARSLQVRNTLWKLASLFNPEIRFALLDFTWSFSEIVTSGMMLRLRFLAFTFIMWLTYFTSYLMFGRATHAPTSAVAYEMLGSPLHSMAQRAMQLQTSGGETMTLAFGLLPVLMILLMGLLREKNSFVRVFVALLRGRFATWETAPSLVSERFKEESEYEYFLTSLFAGKDLRFSSFGLRAIEDGIVHRMFRGGSGAVTALVEANDTLMIRKFTIGEDKNKLKAQVDWLRSNAARLPLVDVLQERMETAFYRYDMPYFSQADDFYDAIHTAPLERSRSILQQVVDTVHGFHTSTSLGDASSQIVEAYLRDKVSKNATAVLDFMRELLPGEGYLLNGKSYSLRDWDRLQDSKWLQDQVRHRGTASIHGDLTIENIIVSPVHARGWYIIDPNPGNLFDTPLIDWAKLMQSLHLGYEGLNRSGTCTWKGGELALSITRSHAYEELYVEYGNWIDQHLGPDARREIAFHELVNYLRLVPYKIRQSPAKGLTFFACTSILLSAYLEQYD